MKASDRIVNKGVRIMDWMAKNNMQPLKVMKYSTLLLMILWAAILILGFYAMTKTLWLSPIVLLAGWRLTRAWRNFKVLWLITS